MVGEEPVRRFRRTDDDPGLRAHLGRHAGEGDPVTLRQPARSMEFDAGVPGAIRADLADDAHDRVLDRHALARAAGERDLDRLGHPQPRPAKRERNGDIGRTHPRAEGAHRAIRVGVRIAPHDDRARFAVALLDHDLVADAFSGVVERRDPLLPHPLAEDPMRVRDDGCGRGRGVIDEHSDPRGVPDPVPAEVTESGDDRVDDRVVDHDARDRRDDEVPGTGIPAGDA